MAPALLFTDNAWAVTGSGAAMVVYLVLVPTCVAYLMLARGLRSIPAPHAQTIGLTEPLVATLLGVIVVDESLAAVGVVGAVLSSVASGCWRWPTPRENTPVTHRSGFACFVGRPNAGKSTLTNALVG